MKIRPFALAACVTLASLGFAVATRADTTNARCDVYPKGEDRATSSDTCTFSQRQGYVTITLRDGTTYELSPSPDQPATYTDQSGRPATREDALGDSGTIYRLADVSIFVYWDASAVSETAPQSTAPATLPTGISLSQDGQTLVMASGSSLDVYCNQGQGMLAISYVGEGGIPGQVVGCGQTYAPFDTARNNGFASVKFVAPVVQNDGLQLQDAQYTKVDCQADHAGLSQAQSDNSDGHMSLECL